MESKADHGLFCCSQEFFEIETALESFLMRRDKIHLGSARRASTSTSFFSDFS